MKAEMIEEAFLAVMNANDRALSLPLSDFAGRNLLRRRIAVALYPLALRLAEVEAERDRLIAPLGRIAKALETEDQETVLEAINDLFAEGLITVRRQLEELP